MSTTYSNDIGIKKIGTGLEAGTWGNSTSQNLERLSDSINRAVEIDLIDMPTGSTNAASGATPGTAIWVLLDASDSLGPNSDVGSEGRCSLVEVNDGTEITATNVTMQVRGQTTSTNINRQFCIWNNLTSANLIIDCAGGTMTLRNGKYAIVNCISTTVGSLGAGPGPGVHNALADPQFDGVTLIGTSGILFDQAAPITIPANSATALTITDLATDLVTFDTNADEILLETGNPNGVVIDVSGQNVQPFVQIVADNLADATIIRDTATNVMLTVDTTTGTPEIAVGATGLSVDLRVWGDVQMDDVAHAITIPDALDPAFSILSTDASEYLNILSSATADDRRIDIKVPVTAPDIALTGADAYIEFSTEVFDGTGYGLRDLAGVMQVKSSGGGWEPIQGQMNSGGAGNFFESTAITLVASSAPAVQAHGLLDAAVAVRPTLMTCSFRCTSADIGYSVDDEILLSDINGSADSDRGVTCFSDDTNVGLIVGTVLTTVHKTAWTASAADLTKWVGIIRAWV
jgi:hypothetical protein